MKKGFTILELLAVIAILAFLGVASIVLFSKNIEDINSEDLKNRYKEIQTAATLYIDLNDSWLSSFTESGEAFIRLGVLQNENYVSDKMTNPITGEIFPSSYLVKVYIKNIGDSDVTKQYVDSCIISYESDNNIKCISNADGNACGCCDYPISSLNVACTE